MGMPLTCCPGSSLTWSTLPLSRYRPRSPRRLPPLRRGDRTQITAGPGMILMASGLAVAHPRTHDHAHSGGSPLLTGGMT